MGSFKVFLRESEGAYSKIMLALDDMDPEEIDPLGGDIYYNFFDDEDGPYTFEKADVIAMVDELGEDLYDDILDFINYSEEEEEEELDEGVSRRMSTKHFNKVKRKFMMNSVAELRRTRALRKKEAREKRAGKKRYYRANKMKIAAYQKSRNAAIEKGKHNIKLRRKAG